MTEPLVSVMALTVRAKADPPNSWGTWRATSGCLCGQLPAMWNDSGSVECRCVPTQAAAVGCVSCLPVPRLPSCSICQKQPR